jgi:peptidoglycan/LPS O-acetylase OafA/YrhL
LKTPVNPSHLVQIDVLKGLAIIAVIMMHTVTSGDLIDTATVSAAASGVPSFQLSSVAFLILLSLSTRQAIPVFVVLLGVNSGLSFIRRKYISLKDGYSKDYLTRRFKRFYVPFLIILACSLLVGLFETHISGINQVHLSVFALVGVMPITVPGNYFLVWVFEFVLMFPLLFYLYKKRPRLVLIGSIVIALLFQSIFLFSQQIPQRLDTSFIRGPLPGIALGLWISEDLQLFSKRNRFVLLGSVVAIVYFVLRVLTIYSAMLQPLNRFIGILYPLAFFYPTMLVLLSIKYLPTKIKSGVVSLVTYFGRASYHIFLVQMLYFNLFFFFGGIKVLNPSSNLLLYIIIFAGNLVCCGGLGFLFMRGNAALERHFQVTRT